MNKTQAERTGKVKEPEAFAVVNKNEEILMNSSSGGAFTLFAEKIINEGGVVFGARFNENWEVVHDYTETIEGLAAFRGSKYVQSRIADAYKQVKNFLTANGGRKVLFSGTPCQIGGLKSYLQKDYENLICVDLICHGIPSPKVWLKFVDYIEKINKQKSRKIDFRRKGAWNQYSVSFVFTNDTEYWNNPDTFLFYEAFFSDVCNRKSCYNCGFKSVSRISDITIADFWGIENVVPEMFDAIKGTSLVLIQSEKGASVFNSVKKFANVSSTDLLESIKNNSSIIKSTAIYCDRNKFIKKSNSVSFDILVKKYINISFFRRASIKTRRILGKIERTLLKNGEK